MLGECVQRDAKKKNTHPRVLRKADTLPSANRETMSPRWRKVPDPNSSPIFDEF